MTPVDTSSRYGIVSKKIDVALIFFVGVWNPCERCPRVEMRQNALKEERVSESKFKTIF